jgi:polysaccharide biosynthesis transport protein
MSEAIPVGPGPILMKARPRSVMAAGPDPFVIDASVTPRKYWSVLRRRWPTALAIFLAAMIAAVVGTSLQKPVYRASGLLEIRPESTAAVSLDNLFTSDRLASDDLATQFGVLKSETLTERVVNELGLQKLPEFAPSTSWWRPWSVPPPNDVQRVALAFQQQLVIDPQPGSRLVRVSFDTSDPQLSARIVNSVLDNYVRLRMEDAQQSARWLSSQLVDARAKLDDSQHKLQSYVRSQGLQVFETGQGETENLVNDRMKQLHEQLVQAQADRFQKQSAFELANRQAGGSGGNDMDNPVIQSLTVRLADLKREAARLASTFQEDYPKLKETRSQIAEVQRALDDEVKLSVSRSRRDYRAAERRESLLQDALNHQQTAAQGLEAKSAGYESLKRDVVTNQQLYTALNQKLKEVGISAALKATNVGIVDRAKPPLTQYQSPLTLTLAIAAALGLLLGIGGMLAREYFDGTLRSVEEVHASLAVPALAAIPAVALKRGLRRPAAVGGGREVPSRLPWRRRSQGKAERQRTALREAFAALRTAVLIGTDTPSLRTLLVTSARQGEGKTTVSVNLALSLARLGRRVVLVDADLRRPSVHATLGLGDEPGLADYLAHRNPWGQCIRTYSPGNLDVLVGGRGSANPSEDIASSDMRDLIGDLSRQYDFVIVDSPPLLLYPADVRMLAALTEGSLLTVRSGATPREEVVHALAQLPRAAGVVLNAFDLRDAPSYYRQAYDTVAVAGAR